MDPGDFPRTADLRRGAILSTIAHAISMAADAQFAYELGWDGPNYLRQNGQGTRGAITFTASGVVGAMCDDDSPRTPWRAGLEYTVDQLFAGIPENLRTVAEQHTLQFLLDEWEGREGPFVTAAFWNMGERLIAVEPWEDVVTHGAHLIGVEVMSIEDAISELQDAYELPDAQVDLLKSLFSRKLNSPDTAVALESREYDVLVSEGINGLDECRKLLAAVGIIIPGGS